MPVPSSSNNMSSNLSAPISYLQLFNRDLTDFNSEVMRNAMTDKILSKHERKTGLGKLAFRPERGRFVRNQVGLRTPGAGGNRRVGSYLGTNSRSYAGMKPGDATGRYLGSDSDSYIAKRLRNALGEYLGSQSHSYAGNSPLDTRGSYLGSQSQSYVTPSNDAPLNGSGFDFGPCCGRKGKTRFPRHMIIPTSKTNSQMPIISKRRR